MQSQMETELNITLNLLMKRYNISIKAISQNFLYLAKLYGQKVE
jgi:hypothetical protein